MMQTLYWFRSRAGLLALAGWAVLGTGTARSDSLWHQEGTRSMFADKRASAVGDLLTIIVQENNSATKDSNTKTSKKSSVDASLDTFLYSPGASSFLTQKGQMPAMKFGNTSSFNGGGSVNNSETIAARIPVRVVDVLPNHTMVIEGRRKTAFAGEQQEVVLRGVVREEDVAANNTVFSYNVADATIQFVSKGALNTNQKRGWFTRIWDKVSPF